MRMILAVIVVLVIGVGPHWQKYKDEKIAAYQARHGGDVCDIHNVLIGVECRPFTRAELETRSRTKRCSAGMIAWRMPRPARGWRSRWRIFWFMGNRACV